MVALTPTDAESALLAALRDHQSMEEACHDGEAIDQRIEEAMFGVKASEPRLPSMPKAMDMGQNRDLASISGHEEVQTGSAGDREPDKGWELSIDAHSANLREGKQRYTSWRSVRTAKLREM